MNLPKISVVIPCYTMDRFRDITELLDSLQSQSYTNIETIVVAERSPELVENINKYAYNKNYLNVQVLYNQNEWGASASRNLGIRQASGQIIAFVDDDAVPFPTWAEEMVTAYVKDGTIIGLTGPILPLWEVNSMAWFPKEFYWIFSCTYWDWTDPTEVRNGYGTNISFRKEAFELCGYFKPFLGAKGGGESGKHEIGGEETELSLRIRHQTHKRIVYHPNIKVKHKVYSYRFTSSFIRKRAYWEGCTKAAFNKAYRFDNESVLSTEYKLLYRIFFRLMPSLLLLLFSHPVIALRQLWVTILALTCVAIGYLVYTVSNLFKSKQQLLK
jgi:glucosyl-dolichyl phosphate glucuronosyltransferase